jgi:hypothetical protein
MARWVNACEPKLKSWKCGERERERERERKRERVNSEKEKHEVSTNRLYNKNRSFHKTR